MGVQVPPSAPDFLTLDSGSYGPDFILHTRAVANLRAEGHSWAEVCRTLKLSRGTVGERRKDLLRRVSEVFWFCVMRVAGLFIELSP